MNHAGLDNQSGGALGLLFAEAGTRALIALVSSEDHQIDLALDADWRVPLFAVVISVASRLLFGLAPAWRGTDAALRTAPKEGTRSSANRGLTRKALVAAHGAVSLVLLIAAGLFIRTLYNLRAQVVGLRPRRLVIMNVDPVAAGYRGDDVGRACVELMHRLGALPGVRTITFSENGLFSGAKSGERVDVLGVAPTDDDDRIARFDQIGPCTSRTSGFRCCSVVTSPKRTGRARRASRIDPVAALPES